MYKDKIFQIMNKTSHTSGEEFLKVLVLSLSKLADFDYAFVGALDRDDWNITTLAFASSQGMQDNFSYNLKGTPCEYILDHEYHRFAENVCKAFPDDYVLNDLSIEGYVGYPLVSVDGDPIGILVLLQQSFISEVDESFDMLRFFARRCESELERMILEQSLIEIEEKLEKASSVREDILHNISHELRTPLNAIIGFSDLLGDSDLLDVNRENVEDYLLMIKDSAEVLNDSITDIVDFSTLRSGQYEPEMSIYEINHLMDKCIRLKKLKFPNIIFHSEISVCEVYAKTDASLFEKIITSILDNAAKFSKPASTVKIMLCDPGDQQLEISILDSGPGICQVKLEELQKSLTFDGCALSKKTSGLGLGLAYVSYASKLLGIKVNFESESGKSTLVTITMPSTSPETTI